MSSEGRSSCTKGHLETRATFKRLTKKKSWHRIRCSKSEKPSRRKSGNSHPVSSAGQLKTSMTTTATNTLDCCCCCWCVVYVLLLLMRCLCVVVADALFMCCCCWCVVYVLLLLMRCRLCVVVNDVLLLFLMCCCCSWCVVSISWNLFPLLSERLQNTKKKSIQKIVFIFFIYIILNYVITLYSYYVFVDMSLNVNPVVVLGNS